MKNAKILVFGIVVVLLLSMALPAYATAVNYTDQPDATSGKDAHMRNGVPNQNFGVTATMDIKGDDNRRSLIEFSLPSLPSYAVVESSYLRLFVTANPDLNPNPVVNVYLVTQPWVEGTEDGASVADDGATWNRYDGTNNWATAGGDFDDTTVWASTTIPSINNLYTWNVTDLVKSWLDGSYSNYGFLVRTTTSGSGTTSFATSDNSNSAQRPILEINYILQEQFAWDSLVAFNNVAAGENFSIWDAVTVTGDQNGTSVNSLAGNGSSFILFDYDNSDVPDTVYDGDYLDVAWFCAPEIMQSPGIYEVIYNINSTQNTTGENITVQCTVDPYNNNEPSVTIDNDSSVNVSTSTPIVYVTVTDDPEQPSAYAEIIANGTNVSYALLQNSVSTPMQWNSTADGIYDYYARAYDNFSNAVNGENLTILIDTTKPTISNSSAMRINQTVNNNTWVANFTVTDNFYLVGVTIEINGTNYTPVQQGNYFTYSANLSLGNNTVNVYANDSLGNEERMLNGWIVYSLPPAPSAVSDLPSGGSTKPGLLDSILAALLLQQQSPTPTAQSPLPTPPAPTAPINPSPVPSPTPTSGAPGATGTAPTGAAVATGTENGVQGDAVTGFVTFLRNVTTIIAVLLIGTMLGFLLWIQNRRKVSF